MKTRNAMQLKALVNNYAVENRLIPQIVLQNYHLQRFVERLVRSKYRKKFVIKGGLTPEASDSTRPSTPFGGWSS